MTAKRRKRHSPEQIIRKLRDADAMLNAGKGQAAVLQALEISDSTFARWRNQYGGMKAEEAKRLKELEDENKRLKQLVAEKELDIQMLKHVTEGNWEALLANAPQFSLCKSSSTYQSVVLAAWLDNHAAASDTSRNLARTSRRYASEWFSCLANGRDLAIAASPGVFVGKAGEPATLGSIACGVEKG